VRSIYGPIALVAILVVGCSGGARVTVSNESSATLNSLTLSGEGFSQSLGSLEPGAKRDVRIRPSGETSLSVTFVANGKKFESPPAGYFEGGGYRVRAEVKPNFEVAVRSTLESY